MKRLFSYISSIPLAIHISLTVVIFILKSLTLKWYEASHIASKFPVSYMKGQSTFNAKTLEGYFAVLVKMDTLDLYVKSQLVDFLYISTNVLLGLFFPLLLRRLYSAGSWKFRLSTIAVYSILLGATFDVVENCISFIFVANPTGLSEPLVFIYSFMATAKFPLVAGGFILTIFSLISFLVDLLFRKTALKSRSV